MHYSVQSIQEHHIESYWSTVDIVAKERCFISLLEAPSIIALRDYTLKNIQNQWPHVVAVTHHPTKSHEQVVGWCDIIPLELPIYAHVGCLGIGILEPFRGKGLGEKLVCAALQQAKNVGLTRVELVARQSNLRAIKLYKKLGFVVEGVHKNRVLIDDHYEDQVFMGLSLKK